MIDQKFNIVIPMAGEGSRFKKAGYKDSKPFIEVLGKPMIQRVIENLQINFNNEYNTILLCQEKDYSKYDLSFLENIIPNLIIHVIEEVTKGAACTVLLAERHIDNNSPVLMLNSDQMIDYNPYKTFIENNNYDGIIPCFKGSSPEWSYAKTDQSTDLVVEVAEKKVISQDATAGYYYWKKGSDFVKYAKEMIKNKDTVNGEYYVAPVYNYAIKDNKEIKVTLVDKVYELGTPEHLNNFINQKKQNL